MSEFERAFADIEQEPEVQFVLSLNPRYIALIEIPELHQVHVRVPITDETETEVLLSRTDKDSELYYEFFVTRGIEVDEVLGMT